MANPNTISNIAHYYLWKQHCSIL